MKIGLLLIVSLMPIIALADDTLPMRPDFNRYQAMLNRSFAIETVAAPTAAPDPKASMSPVSLALAMTASLHWPPPRTRILKDA